MRKKLLIRAGFGFLFGDVMVLLIPAFFNRTADGATRLFSNGLIARAGSPEAALILSLLIYGLYGACCMGGTLLYDIENWSIAQATAAHYLVIALGYVLCAQLLCWQMPMKLLLMIEGFMTVGFILIWLFLYLGYKREVQELNRLMQENQTKGEDNIT